jgi:ubiquinone/menaquinone biosynthesis C-methylase UbiE
MFSDIARKLLPAVARQKVADFYYEQKLFKAARALSLVRGSAITLGSREFDAMIKEFPVGERVSYSYDAVLQRSEQRAEEMITVMQSYTRLPLMKTLELGAGEGMVSACLQRMGKQATAIEIRDDAFDQRAVEAGVQLHKMDASALEFDDRSFDFVFSYNCFEHFPDPEKVFRESLRVLKPGGLMSVRFAPLYHSPFGAHAYNIMGIPYCQFLFDKAFLNEWIDANSEEKLVIDFSLNKWHVDDFRKLFKQKFWQECSVMSYKEFRLPAFLDLVIQYPGCFKNKISSMDDLIVSEIHAVFQKR